MHELRAALALASIASISLAAPPQDGDGEPVRDGKYLYTRNCAGCHNDNGDGRGPTILELGLTARDFAQGGFAFGDTREAMLRTISTGIPGRSPMPSFRGILTDEEMGLVVDHVRTLMPPRKDEAPANTELIVRDRPVIARGKLPPIADGAKETVRGLLIGTPEGMTFEYDASDVRLLGVRLGRFADRTDWSGRGGSYLKPLGQLVWNGTANTRLSVIRVPTGPGDASQQHPHVAVLRSTWSRVSECGLAYDARIESSGGKLLATIEETVATRPLSIGPGFTRRWRGKFAVHEPVDAKLEFGFDVRFESVSGDDATWAVHDLGETGVDAIRIETGPEEMDRFTLEATTVRLAKWTPELAQQLSAELRK